MLALFDGWLLDRHERFAHKCQLLFGINCFSLARICLLLTYASYFFPDLVRYLSGMSFGEIIPTVFLKSLIVVLWVYPNFRRVTIQEKLCEKNQLSGVANSEKLSWRYRMTIFVSAIIFSWFVPLLTPLFGFFIALNYFLACDPLPPGKSKVRQWLEAGVQFLRETLTPVPQPQPVPVPSK